MKRNADISIDAGDDASGIRGEVDELLQFETFDFFLTFFLSVAIVFVEGFDFVRNLRQVARKFELALIELCRRAVKIVFDDVQKMVDLRARSKNVFKMFSKKDGHF